MTTSVPPRGTVEFLYMANAGLVPGCSRMVMSGFNADVDLAVLPQSIWGGTGLIPRPAGNESWEIVGGPNDTAAGTGARTVSLTTLDASYVAATNVIALNGATAVPIPGNCRFANVGRVLTSGSAGQPSQPLEIRVAGGGASRAFIGIEGVLNQGKFTVPDGFRLEVHSAVLGVRTDGVTTQSAVFNNAVIAESGNKLAPLRLPIVSSGGTPYRHELAGGLIPYVIVNQRFEVDMRVSVVTANNTQVDCSILALLYDRSIWPN